MHEQIQLIEHSLATKADIEALRLTMKADSKAPRVNLTADFAALRRHIRLAKAELIKWIAGTDVAAGVLIVAAIKFLQSGLES